MLFEIAPSTRKTQADSTVYTKNRCFCLPLCSKSGTTRFLKIITDHTFEDAIVTLMF